MVTTRPAGARGIEEILADARGRLRRLTPDEAFRERAEGAVLIDIRPAGQRAGEGEIPGSAIVERNHLEWRLDPGCDARLPWVTGYEHRIIVFCQEGYTSSLAAVGPARPGLVPRDRPDRRVPRLVGRGPADRDGRDGHRHRGARGHCCVTPLASGRS